MEKEKLAKLKLPDAPGVYFFLGPKKEILYIGKATSLRNRVRSYFASDIIEKRSPLIEQMVSEAKTVEHTVTDSVLEALILETNLIRSHKPKFNTKSKDDKSYNHLIITNEDFPRVLVVREKDLTEKYTEAEIKYHFGPFTSGSLFREALKIVRRLFQFYDTKTAIDAPQSKFVRGKIDFNRQIGLYPDVQSKDEYKKTIRHIKLFFEGKKKTILKELEAEMMDLAKLLKFEEAHQIKKKIFALTHIQDMALIKVEKHVYRDEKNVRIEAYDIAHMAGKDMVGVMTVVEGGETNKNEYRKFKIKTLSDANDPAALKEVLRRRLEHTEWPYPQIIAVDGNIIQINAAKAVLLEYKVSIPIVAVVKDDRHKFSRLLGPAMLLKQHRLEIQLANSEAHRFAITYFRQSSRKRALQ